MVMVTAKVSKQKLFLIAALIVVVVIVLCLCLHGSEEPPAQNAPQDAQSVDVKTNEGRVAFLQSFGWEVAEEPVQTQEVRVPAEGNEVFERYNELQRSQGYDLTQYAGKTLHRYVYSITNYPGGEGAYYATVLVYKNEVVGGDVCSAAQDGVMHSFNMPA